MWVPFGRPRDEHRHDDHGSGVMVVSDRDRAAILALDDSTQFRWTSGLVKSIERHLCTTEILFIKKNIIVVISSRIFSQIDELMKAT